jgi:hypothetical protein
MSYYTEGPINLSNDSGSIGSLTHYNFSAKSRCFFGVAEHVCSFDTNLGWEEAIGTFQIFVQLIQNWHELGIFAKISCKEK